MNSNLQKATLLCSFMLISLVVFSQKKATPEQKFMLAWHNTKNFFDTEAYYAGKDRAKKAQEILKDWSKISSSDYKTLDNQVLEHIAEAAISYLKGNKSVASKKFAELKNFRNSNNVLTKSNWRQIENLLGRNVYYLDSMYAKISPQEEIIEEQSVLKYTPVFRNITPLAYATLQNRLKIFNTKKSEDRKDRMLIELLMAQVAFVSDTTILDAETYKTKLDSLKIKESKLFDDPVLLSWAEKNRKLVSLLSKYLMTYIDGGTDDCKLLQNMYEHAFELNKSFHPLDRVRLTHYETYYGINFEYIYNMIESCGCDEVKEFAWDNYEKHQATADQVAQQQYKSVLGRDLNQLQIKVADIVTKNELEKLKRQEAEFLATWQEKIDIIRNNSAKRIQDYIQLNRERMPQRAHKNRASFLRKHDNYHSDRHLAVLLDQYFEQYLVYPSIYTAKTTHDMLEGVFDEAVRLYKSTSPRDRILALHLKQYYGIDFDFVLDVIRKSPFEDLKKRLSEEEQGHRNEFHHYSSILVAGYQLKPINLNRVDIKKVNAVEQSLLPVLNQKLALYQQDLTRTNIYDFSQRIKDVVNNGKKFVLRYTDNNAVQEEIQSLYDLDRFYLYLLMAKYSEKDSQYKDENALFRLKRSYESIKKDYTSGHPLRKTRSKHYAKHYGISLSKLNQIIAVNQSCVPYDGSIQKVVDVDRNPTPFHPGKGNFDIGTYDAEHILEGFRQKWALEGELMNRQFEYIYEFMKLRERLKSEHPTISKYKDAKVVSDLDPRQGYYKDLFYLTEAFEEYLLKDHELEASPIVCDLLRKGTVKSGNACADYEFLTNTDFDQAFGKGTGPTSIRPKEACFGIDEIHLKEILEAGLCCPKGSIPVAPTVTFATTQQSATEGIEKTVTVTIQLSNPFPKKIEVPMLLKGTAIAGVDYQLNLSANRVEIPAQTTTRSFTVQVLNDSLKDWDKVLKLELADPVNAMAGKQNTFQLTIADDDNTLEKQAKARVKTLLFKGFDGEYIEIAKVKDEDLPGELRLKGKDGAWFIVKLKHLQKALLFEGGRYSIDDKRMHGGEGGDENYELYRKSMFEFRKVIVGILDTYGEEQNKDLYQIFLVGGADKVVFQPKELAPEYNSKMFTSIPVVPYDEQKKEHRWGTDSRLLVGQNSYRLGSGHYKCSHANFKYCNADLPHLRAAFIRYMFTDFFEIKESSVSILQGFVSDRVRNEDRNCLILMNVDKSLVKNLPTN
ncbi:MAG: hypothetical protein ACPGJS_17570 [Flammeovirgaceae bacterium]